MNVSRTAVYDKLNGVETNVSLSDAGKSLPIRRVVLKLKKPDRNGENEIVIFTMLPTPTVTAAVVTQLYREGRSVENLFQNVGDWGLPTCRKL
ncbi:MAG: hypothetical protein V7L01_06415 [Nostoc sp.]|uniref:hypothetical protein n=1 Tax=Nostoc sp. TaxID=1180 RepID=UPI002FFCE121